MLSTWETDSTPSLDLVDEWGSWEDWELDGFHGHESGDLEQPSGSLRSLTTALVGCFFSFLFTAFKCGGVFLCTLLRNTALSSLVIALTVISFPFYVLCTVPRALRIVRQILLDSLCIGMFMVAVILMFCPSMTLGLASGCLFPSDPGCEELFFLEPAEARIRILSRTLSRIFTGFVSLFSQCFLCPVFACFNFSFSSDPDTFSSGFLNGFSQAALNPYRFLALFHEDFGLMDSGDGRRVLDSGATTNLVKNLLPNDWLVASQKMCLALGQTKEAAISFWGDVIGGDQELISMGKFVHFGGRVLWDSPKVCELYIPGESSTWEKLFDVSIEKYCPLLTSEQALSIRQFIRAAESKESYIQQFQSKKKQHFSSACICLGVESPSFEHFCSVGFFDAHSDAILALDQVTLRELWQNTDSPHAFLDKVAVAASFERGGESFNLFSNASNNRSKRLRNRVPDQPNDENVVDADSEQLFNIEVGPRPDAAKAPQQKTPLAERLSFYQQCGENVWVIFGDVHSCSVRGFTNEEKIWCYHCSRLIVKENEDGSKEPKIQTVLINVPIHTHDGQSACSSLRFVLQRLGIWATKTPFFFESENEGAVGSELFQEWLLLTARGFQHFSIPFRHPWKEVTVRICVSRVRKQLGKSKLPHSAWPSIVRAQTEENLHTLAQSAPEVASSPYQNKTFDRGYSAEWVGRMGLVNAPALKIKSVQLKQIPCLVLHSEGRQRVYVVHSTDKDLGFRYTSVDIRELTWPSEEIEWAFSEDIENLRTRRFMHQKFENKILLKPKGHLPRTLACKRCLRLSNHGTQLDEENHPTKGHTCGVGCNYQNYHCFSEGSHLTFDAQIKDVDDEVEAIQSLLQADFPVDDDDDKIPSNERERVYFHRLENSGQDQETFRSLTHVFKENPTLKSSLFNVSNITSEEAATFLFLTKNESMREVKKDVARRRKQSVGGERFFAIVVDHKSILQSEDPAEVLKWIEGADREIETLIANKVLKLIDIDELENVDPSTYEIIPSLVVWTRKDDGRCKARLVACGNFKKPVDTSLAGLQEGHYAGTTSLVGWHSCINLFVQCRGSVCTGDAMEAFTQSDAKKRGQRQTILRLPSQWKSKLLPTFLASKGVNLENYHKKLLAVLKSIYGEHDAQQMFAATVRRVAISQGFSECILEEGAFFKVVDGCPCILTSYVDDLWLFTLDEDLSAKIMYDFSREIRITPVQYLCGAPRFVFRSEKKLNSEESRYRESQAFTLYEGTQRWDVARKDAPVSYVSIKLYFQEFSDGQDASTFLVFDQSEYLERSIDKLLSKKVIEESPVPVYSLQACTFNHLFMFEECDANPLLSPEDLTKLRSGINTLSYCCGATTFHLSAALGSVARGQSAGRARHLKALRVLIGYAYTMRFNCLCTPVPSWLEKVRKVTDMRVILEADVDASLGSTQQSGTDPFARQGYLMSVGVHREVLGVCSGRTNLQTTIAVSTCEAEVTAVSFCARALLGTKNMLSVLLPGASFEVPSLFGDNEASNRLMAGQASMRHMRHLRLPQVWARTCTANGELRIYSKRSAENTSDMLTKVLSHQVISRLWRFMNVRAIQ